MRGSVIRGLSVGVIAISLIAGGSTRHVSGAASGPLVHNGAPLVSRSGVGSGSAMSPAAKRRTKVAHSATHAQRRHQRITKPTYLVLIVVDGARPDYFNTSDVPHLRAAIREGTWYDNAFAGILESETPSGHAAIATGSEPRDDGVLSFSWAKDDNKPVDLFNPVAIRAGAMEAVMKHAGAPTIASLVHRGSPKAKVVALSGYKYYAVDALGGPDADVIMYFQTHKNGQFSPVGLPSHMPPAGIMTHPDVISKTNHYPLGVGNHMAMRLAAHAFARMHQKVTLINLPETDWPLGHPWGANHDLKDMHTLMRGFDHDLATLENTYRAAGVLDRTLFVVTSDHGFAPIAHHVPSSLITGAIKASGTRIIRDTYHTGAYVWLEDESKAAEAASRISYEQNPYIQSVYFRSTGTQGPTYLRATGPDLLRAGPYVERANQTLLRSFNGPTGPDLVVFYTEEAAGVGPGQGSWKGDHGGADWESQHLPLLMWGPGVRKGYRSSKPARLEDIAPSVLMLMGYSSKGMRGVPLADSMLNPPGWAKTEQVRQVKAVSPVVTALKAEAESELRRGL